MKRISFTIFSLAFFIIISLIGCGDDITIINNNNSTVPAPPILTNPPNGSVDSMQNTTFGWNASSGATSYKIQISTDTGFVTIVNENTISTNSYTLPNGILQPNTTYYWRVKGVNDIGEGSYSATWYFYTVNIISNSIVGTWVLIYSAGTLDICPGEQVVFPSNTAGTAQLTCPGGTTIMRQYTRTGNTLTYTASSVQYAISFTQNNELVLTGINNNRILYYTRVISREKSGKVFANDTGNSSEIE
jgi:hypothetical protein